MDENQPICDKRFAKLGIPQTEEAKHCEWGRDWKKTL